MIAVAQGRQLENRPWHRPQRILWNSVDPTAAAAGKTQRVGTIKLGSNYLRGDDRRIAGRPADGLRAGEGNAVVEVPRHLPAGRPRPAQRAGGPEAGAGLPVHDPRAGIRRNRHAGPVAGPRSTGAGVRQRHPAVDHAAVLAAARHDQVEAARNDPPDQRDAC